MAVQHSMTTPSGTIFDIMKFAIHDGPGIRTTVFLKGCPLKCLWCHNPESQKREKEISFIPGKCIGCGWCFECCPQQAHVMQNGKHVLLRDRCVRCGVCAEKCYAKAIEVIGRDITVGEVLAEVLKDKPFYDNSGGGMTISGGEPMMQFEFTEALLRAAKEAGLHTCLDTSGFAPINNYLKLLDVVDIFLYDIKDTDPERHMKTTAVPLELILDNLKKLDAANGKTILRCPLVSGINADDDHLKKIAEIANTLTNVIAITLHPYHPLGKSKSERIGVSYPLPDNQFSEAEQIDHWLGLITASTKVPVRKSNPVFPQCKVRFHTDEGAASPPPATLTPPGAENNKGER
jgi:glycyl-radical enzyme activating protein